jgi:predicted ATPase/class 3 adenylate cyclase/Tfp pilus assembly protein PilF
MDVNFETSTIRYNQFDLPVERIMTNPSLNSGQRLPSGTITFLFTDIEGSTRLLQQLGERYARLLAEQEQLLRETWSSHHGIVLGTQGDSFFVAFSNVMDAIHAVVRSQRALAAHRWEDDVAVRVRMGLHTGEAQITELGYVGIDVHRAARIAAAAHGGQILLSQSTHDLVASQLPSGLTLQDLGKHRLKDLRQPRQLFQLVIPDLPTEFPPIKSLDALLNNLPMQLTSFIGRQKELSELQDLLKSTHLLTLTGPGGSGKTRLALQVASEMIDQFRNGVFFIALAPISDPRLVASAIAQPLGIKETAGRSIADNLQEYLRGKSLLLILDNFEQVISAAPFVAQLLATCHELRILITSREGLRISGEQEYPVPPLVLPDLAGPLSNESLSQYPAVELFVQRAKAAKPDFRITNETAPVIAEICHRLDGLPLAIELAAARIRLFSPRTMLDRLANRLEFLSGGARDLPARQQTLRNAIAWSYDLLDEKEQRLFRRLSVFVSGCMIDAVEALAEDPLERISILGELGSLVDKSLLRQIDDAQGEPRFMMLELLHEFGLEQLAASGEQESIRLWHAQFFLLLAEQAESKLESAEQLEWVNRMEQEHDNLRSALTWSMTADSGREICVRLATTLGLFWEVRGYFSEGRERVSAVLATDAAQGQTLARSRLLARAAELAYRQSDYPATIAFAEESLEISRKIEDKQGIASALIKLGNAATEVGDYKTASAYLEECLGIWRVLDDRHGTARALISSGWVALRAGDDQLAKARLEEALSISRDLGDTRSIGFELSGLGEVALRQGDYASATRLLEESLALRRQLGNKWGVGVSLGTLGWVAICQGDWARAAERLGESLQVRHEIGDKGGSAWCLERLAEIALAHKKSEKAVRLLGAAAALRISIGSVIDPADQAEYENKLTTLRTQLGISRFGTLWDEGHALPLEEAIRHSLEE